MIFDSEVCCHRLTPEQVGILSIERLKAVKIFWEVISGIRQGLWK